VFGWGLTLLSAVVMAHIAWRATSISWLAPKVSKRTLWLAAAMLWGVMTLGRMFRLGASFPGASLLELIGMTLLGMLFLCFLPLLLVDVVTGFGLWFRNSSLRFRGWALLVGVGLSCLASLQGLREPEVVDYEVKLQGLPQNLDGLVMVALSDLHLGATLGPRWLEARVVQVQALKPDVVVILGDVFEGHGPPGSEFLRILHGIKAPLGVWGVDGNHEQHDIGGSPLKVAGVRVLRNATASLAPGLTLAGRSQPDGHGGKSGEPAWKVSSPPPVGAVVLLSHIPNQVQEAAASGVGLMLSGHTHGGQIWPFGYLVRKAYAALDGQSNVGGMSLIINRGTGTWGPRMRLWHRSEISRILLKAGVVR
jgi:predicted MPP superfamily phosphohydrolase